MTSNELSPIEKFGNRLSELKSHYKTVLPRHLEIERYCKIAYMEIKKNPDLLKCKTSEILNNIMQAAQLGLEIGSTFGHVYLLPYYNSNQKIYVCQFILGYKGLIELAHRSDKVISAEAHCVYENDYFEYCYGTDSYLRHQPLLSGDRGRFIAAYGCVKLKNNGNQFRILSGAEIELIKQCSPSSRSQYSPWQKWPDEMRSKSALKKVLKVTPMSAHYYQGVLLDNIGEIGERSPSQILDKTGDIIDLPIIDEEENINPQAKKINSVIDKIDNVQLPPDADINNAPIPGLD